MRTILACLLLAQSLALAADLTPVWSDGSSLYTATGGATNPITSGGGDVYLSHTNNFTAPTNFFKSIIVSNSITIISNLTVSGTINGTATNATYLGGTAAASYLTNNDSRAQTLSNTSVSNALYLGGIAASAFPTNRQAAAFSVTMSASQTNLPASTWTNIAFNTKVLDTHSGFSTTTYRYTVPTTGYWLIGAAIYYNPVPASAGLYSMGVWDSDGNIIMQPVLYSGASSVIDVMATKLCYLTATKYIYVRAYTDRTTTGIAKDSHNTFFWGYLLR